MTATLPTQHALGLPRASVRTILVLLVLGTLCLLLLLPSHPALPPYIMYLTFMILVHYFTIQELPGTLGRGPLGIPLWFWRLVILGGLVGTIGWRMATDLPDLKEQITISIDRIKLQPFLPLLMLGAFFVGYVLHGLLKHILSRFVLTNIEAWLALLGCVAMTGTGLLELVVNPALSVPIEVGMYTSLLIAFYFGARS